MADGISLALIGAGSLGGALLRGWLKGRVIDPEKSCVFDPKLDDAFEDELTGLGLLVNPALTEIPAKDRFETVVLAVKPQVSDAIVNEYKAILDSALVITVMAGRSVDAIERAAPALRGVVRAMPNLPALVGRGATALYAAPSTGQADRERADRLMAAVGETIWVDQEQAIDWATAISGSGPAYYFALTEALVDAGARLGLDHAAAQRLAGATLIGAGALFEADEARDASALRLNVTSPGGTTAAALAAFEAGGLTQLVADAVAAAARRAGELSD